MTLNEIIDALIDIRDNSEDNGDREVILGTQRSYPLRFEIHGAIDGNDYIDPRNYDDDENPNEPIVIVSGDQCYDEPYGNRSWWR